METECFCSIEFIRSVKSILLPTFPSLAVHSASDGKLAGSLGMRPGIKCTLNDAANMKEASYKL